MDDCVSVQGCCVNFSPHGTHGTRAWHTAAEASAAEAPLAMSATPTEVRGEASVAPTLVARGILRPLPVKESPHSPPSLPPAPPSK